MSESEGRSYDVETGMRCLIEIEGRGDERWTQEVDILMSRIEWTLTGNVLTANRTKRLSWFAGGGEEERIAENGRKNRELETLKQEEPLHRRHPREHGDGAVKTSTNDSEYDLKAEHIKQ